MIRERFLLEWAERFPWKRSEQVEQDLLISRAVVAIYSDPYLAERLAWRGGTALYKLYLTPQPRYSEDIDLVLIRPEPMGPILDRLREVLSFIPDKQAKGKRYNHVLKLRFVSEAKLKDPEYRHGMDTLLRPEITFDPDTAWKHIKERIVDRLMTADDIAAMQQREKVIPRSGG